MNIKFFEFDNKIYPTNLIGKIEKSLIKDFHGNKVPAICLLIEGEALMRSWKFVDEYERDLQWNKIKESLDV